MPRLIFISVFSGVIMFFSACKSNMDSSDPVISFIEPAANVLVNIPDTIDVEVDITDDRIIRSVAVSIFDENKIPIVQTKYFTPDADYFKLVTSFELIDKYLTSGSYQVFVTAFDGENTKDNYRTILLEEIPAEINAYIAVGGQFDFKSTIFRMNRDFETDTQFIFPYGHHITSVNGLWEKFLFVTNEPSKLVALNPLGFSVEWTIEAAPPRPEITAVISDRELIFSTSNGDVAISGEDGDIILRTDSFTSKMISTLAADQNYIYAAHVSLSGTTHELTVYYRVTGAIKVQRIVGGEIMSLAPYNNGVLIFMRADMGTEVMEYDPEEMILTPVSVFNAADVYQSIRISDEEYFVLTEMNVLEFDPVKNSTYQFVNQAFELGRYDSLNDLVYLVKDQKISAYKRGSGELIMEKIFAEKLRDFQILYNK